MKRILFVDDEPEILSGLRRMMRSLRGVWEMSFANSAAEALAALDEQAFDVVVTDMKMPKTDGAELLRQVKARHPQTIRIILSGHADVEAAMRSTAVCHQFLTKPCDADALRAVVNRACGLTDLLHGSAVEAVLGGVESFPVLPRVYESLTTALSKEEVDLGEVSDIVEQDVGIATKILQLVNSSFFGIRREVTGIRQATAYLGTGTIGDLVLSFGMFKQFECNAASGFSIEDEQRHSFLAARIARRLLPDKGAAELASLASMLHDAGTLILATGSAEAFAKVVAAGGGVTRPFHAVEDEVLGVSHAEVGAYLLGLWGMPYPVVEAVAHHHHPARVPGQTEFGVLGATHVADCLAAEQAGADPNMIGLDESYLEAAGVLDQVPEWRAIAAEEAGAETEEVSGGTQS